jgi:magnesium chelatase subunit D
LRNGRVVEQIGLLAQANEGIVVVPMSEKLSPQNLAMLLQAHDQGQIHALAIGATHASRFGLVALDESQDDEPGAASKLKERLALWIDMDAVDIAKSQEKIEPLLAQELAQVRSLLLKIQATAPQMRALCEVAFALGIDSMRAPLLALRMACVHAAIHGREFLEEEDLRMAAQMVLSPRATRIPSNQEAESAPPPESPPPPDASNTEQDAAQEDTPPPPATEPESLEDTILAAALASLPPKLLDQLLLGAC